MTLFFHKSLKLNRLLDTKLISVNERFGQLDEYSESWSFLYNIKQIPEKPDLVKLCGDLQLKLTVDPKSDIDGCMLCDELLGGALEISPRALVVLKSERIITRKAAKLT
ncbi:hypothetical protein EVAR_22644_1 [Eumeta japonica]|uniref:Uncharacterized protein n=1 Tax=Eumeta variegata TaxID=151549 RepID=A0A4C1VL53_EUMVA|nr:hypothetical protein EVAR_22644_1 [Eumeta japonica]